MFKKEAKTNIINCEALVISEINTSTLTTRQGNERKYIKFEIISNQRRFTVEVKKLGLSNALKNKIKKHSYVNIKGTIDESKSNTLLAEKIALIDDYRPFLNRGYIVKGKISTPITFKDEFRTFKAWNGDIDEEQKRYVHFEISVEKNKQVYRYFVELDSIFHKEEIVQLRQLKQGDSVIMYANALYRKESKSNDTLFSVDLKGIEANPCVKTPQAKQDKLDIAQLKQLDLLAVMYQPSTTSI